MFKNMFLCASFIMNFIAVANVQDVEKDNQKSFFVQDERDASNRREGKEEMALAFLIEDDRLLSNHGKEEMALTFQVNNEANYFSDILSDVL
jgi:hypothetical protein